MKELNAVKYNTFILPKKEGEELASALKMSQVISCVFKVVMYGRMYLTQYIKTYVTRNHLKVLI